MQLFCSQCGFSALSSRNSFYVGFSLPRHLHLPSDRASRLPPSSIVVVRSEKADLWQLLGGRGLPGGEEVLKNDSKIKMLFGVAKEEVGAGQEEAEARARAQEELRAGDDAGVEGFGKEMMGLTGGFPGGETGLKRFVAENVTKPSMASIIELVPQQRPQAPPLPLLMPGMTVIVKNPRNPFYMYSGIVQRVSDGRVGVLFEGGNWDKLLTFYLEELERTPKGPPMINPKSAVLLQGSPPAPPR
eukprot:c3731_g1_i1 orf=138-869(+)